MTQARQKDERGTIRCRNRECYYMLKAGKMQEIVDQIVGSQIQIVALQEVRWKGYGLLKKDK
jgi:hypothetical protein